jgi:hypothetical protein
VELVCEDDRKDALHDERNHQLGDVGDDRVRPGRIHQEMAGGGLNAGDDEEQASSPAPGCLASLICQRMLRSPMAVEALVRPAMRRRQQQPAGSCRAATAASRWVTPDLATGIPPVTKSGVDALQDRWDRTDD